MASSDADNIAIGPPALSQLDPALVAGAMRVIATWSYVDKTLLDLFASFLGAEQEIVVTMMAKITNRGARDAAFRAIAAHALCDDTDGLDLFTYHTKRISARRKSIRDRYAHWLFAARASQADVLVLVDPRHVAQLSARWSESLVDNLLWQADFERWTATGQMGLPPSVPDALDVTIDKSKTATVKDKDIQRHLEQSERCHQIASLLCSAFDVVSPSAGARRQLFAMRDRHPDDQKTDLSPPQ